MRSRSGNPGLEYSIEAIGSDAVVLENRSIYRELFNLNTTADILSDPAKRSAIVDLVRATISSSDQVRRSPAAIRPLLVSKVNVREETSTAVWGQFRFPATLPEDLLEVLIEEETRAAAAASAPPVANGSFHSYRKKRPDRGAKVCQPLNVERRRVRKRRIDEVWHRRSMNRLILPAAAIGASHGVHGWTPTDHA